MGQEQKKRKKQKQDPGDPGDGNNQEQIDRDLDDITKDAEKDITEEQENAQKRERSRE